MVDIKTCKEKMAVLGLKFQPTAKEKKSLFLELTRKYNPDLCGTPECITEHESKMSQIMDAHLFWKDNHETCNKIISNHIGGTVKGYLHGFDFHVADSYTKNVLGDAVLILEKAGYTFE
jgi:hypothetical protein